MNKGQFPPVQSRPMPQQQPSLDDPAFLVPVLIYLAVFFVVLLLVSLITAVQARRRGYSLLVWTLAGALGNPVFLLVLLGVLPDFRRKKMRITEMKDLEGRLNARTRRIEPGAEATAVPPETVKGRIDRSLGDQPTQLPERSLGDDETRM